MSGNCLKDWKSGQNHASHVWVGNCTVLFLFLLQGTVLLERALKCSPDPSALWLLAQDLHRSSIWCIYHTLNRSRVTSDVHLYREKAAPRVPSHGRSSLLGRREGCGNPHAYSTVIPFFFFFFFKMSKKKGKWESIFPKLVDDKVRMPERTWCRWRKGHGNGWGCS